MQTSQLYLLHFRKATFASLMAMFLISMLPFVTAGSGGTMYAPPLTTPVTIDGAWSAGEWSEAPQYNMQNSTGGNIGYIRAKYNWTHLLVIIDSPWDTTPSTLYWHENAWVAIDRFNDGGGNPQTDDYLLHPAGMAWVGTGNNWTMGWVGQVGAQAGEGFGTVPLGTSPNSATPHRITEMAIPLWAVGSPGMTVGFYALVDDDSTDPDGGGWLPATAYSEWPPNAGGSPGWPAGWWGSAPCPAPSVWGNLILETPPVADIAGCPKTVERNTVVSFDGTGSYDNVGIVAWEWDFGDPYDPTKAYTPTATHTFVHPLPADGVYTVTLTVSDAAGFNDTATCQVNVFIAVGGEAEVIPPPPIVPLSLWIIVLALVIVASVAAVTALTLKKKKEH